MEGRRDDVVEFAQRARAAHRLTVEQSRKTPDLMLALFLHRREKRSRIDKVESPAERVACRHEVDRGRYRRGRRQDILRQRVLAEPFEKAIAAEQHAHRHERSAGGLARKPPKNPADLLLLT